MISFLAPILSVVFGVAIVLLYSKSKPLNLKLFLAFSGAFLLSTTIFELLPAYEDLDLGAKINDKLIKKITHTQKKCFWFNNP